MGEREHSLLSQKRELLKKRKQLLDIKLQLQKDIHTAQPIDFGSKCKTLSEGKILSIADSLHHRFSDVRFLEKLECHLLLGLKVVKYNKSKLVVQFKPSYLEKILPEVYAISLCAGNNGYSVEKYYLPLSVQIQPVVRQWSPLKQDNLKRFLLDIKQHINVFHHRQNEILQLKEWASSKKMVLKVFHPLSLNYTIVTTTMDDNLKSRNCGSLNLVFNYDSNCYLPTTVDVESSEMQEEELAAAKQQLSAFKLYSLKKAFEICCIKTERFSLSVNEDLLNENMNEEDNEGTSVSEEGEEIASVCNSAVSEQQENDRTLSQMNKERRLLRTVEEARKSKSESLLKGKRNRNRRNSSSADENDFAELNTSKAPELLKEARISKFKYSTRGKRNKSRDNRSSIDKNNIAKLSTNDAPKMVGEAKGNRNRDINSSIEEGDIAEVNTDDASEKTVEFPLQLVNKSSSASVLPKVKNTQSKYSTKGTRAIASKGENKKSQTKKQLKTDRKAPKKKYSPDDAQDDILSSRKKKSPDTDSTNYIMKEVPTSLQTNKITHYFLRSKRK